MAGPMASPIWQAVLRGDVAAVKAALANDPAALEARLPDDGKTPLMVAAQAGYRALVFQLIDAGADINAEDIASRTALLHAAADGRADVVSLLLSRDASAVHHCTSVRALRLPGRAACKGTARSGAGTAARARDRH